MKGITIKLPEELHARLAEEARVTGRSIAAVVRDKLLACKEGASVTVHDEARGLEGILAGRRRAVSNARRA